MSHQAFMHLTGAGFTEEQTEALLEVYGDERESFVTKDDLRDLATKKDLQAFATKEELQAMELRLTLRFGGMLAVAVAIVAVISRL